MLWGPVTAAGVDYMGNTVDTLVLPGGTWKIRHSNGTGPQSFNPKTCLLLVNPHGTYTILGGTDKSGRGSALVTPFNTPGPIPRLLTCRKRAQPGRFSSIAVSTAGSSGAVRGRNRAATVPSGRSRNFSKFHWMSPAEPSASGNAVSSV